MEPKHYVRLGIIGLLGVIGFFMCFGVFENLPADRIMVIQSVLGKLSVYTTPGPKLQLWGRVTKFYKLDTYEFENKVRFNEGGHGTMVGSINYELPMDKEHILELYQKFGNQQSIQKDLVEVTVNKCVYMTGPLMSSKESYSEKRTSLIRYIEDQISNGVYRTTQKDVKTIDPITNQEKTVTIVEISIDSSGQPQRQEQAVLGSYGIRTSNFAVTALPYDETVEAQIKQQQEINMKVQTAIASAKEAEQRAITAAKEGEANAATAKWQQETIKAQQVTEAEQKKEVAKLSMDAAEYGKKQAILEGEGEAAKRKLVMQADGALEIKSKAIVAIHQAWAEAMSKYQGNIVPTVQTGESKNGANGFQMAMEAIGVQAMKDLSVNLDVKK